MNARRLVLILLVTFAALGCGGGAKLPDEAEDIVLDEEEVGDGKEAPPSNNKKVVALIDSLNKVSEEGIGTHSTAWASGFIAVDEEPRFEGGMLGSRKPVVNPVMRSLVQMGVSALPDLLNHLSDARKTSLVIEVPDRGGIRFGATWHSDEYHPRYGDTERQPSGVNTKKEERVDKHVVRIGDLCYVAIGQIVNRNLCAVRHQPSACMVINSPVATPALADAVRKDWSGLTKQQHRESLVADATDQSPRAATTALTRLHYYYPKTFEPLVLKLLANLTDVGDQKDFINGLRTIRSDSLDNAVANVFRSLNLEKFVGYERIHADSVALACMDRLIGKGMDAEFETYCEKRIQELQSTKREAAENQRLRFLEERLDRIRKAKNK